MARETGSEYPQEYLGDGVYASYDGYYIWLTLGSHLNHPLVALEPAVLRKLFDYNKLIEGINEAAFKTAHELARKDEK
jgi:hypothetical protein